MSPGRDFLGTINDLQLPRDKTLTFRMRLDAYGIPIREDVERQRRLGGVGLADMGPKTPSPSDYRQTEPHNIQQGPNSCECGCSGECSNIQRELRLPISTAGATAAGTRLTRAARYKLQGEA